MKTFIYILLLVLPLELCAQVGVSARISVIQGGRVFFPILTISDYENGMTLPNYTVLGVTVTDDDPMGPPGTVTDFQITVESVSSAGGDLVGDSGANLDADYIEIQPSNNVGLGTAGETYTNVTLSGAAQTILTSNQTETSWDTHQIAITYVCNPTEPGGNSLFGELADYYRSIIAYDLDVSVAP